MDSESESDSDISVESTGIEDSSDNEEEEVGVAYSHYNPYEHEPLADTDDGEFEDDEAEPDMDGLTPETLTARQDGTVPVNSWLVLYLYCSLKSWKI